MLQKALARSQLFEWVDVSVATTALPATQASNSVIFLQRRLI
jgi:hypothetical protein